MPQSTRGVVARAAPGVGTTTHSVSGRAEGVRNERAMDKEERRLEPSPANVTMGTVLYRVSRNIPTQEEEIQERYGLP
jgi:hypothetical protein